MKPKEKKPAMLNLKASPVVHREIDIESATRGKKIYEIVEEAWALYKANLAGTITLTSASPQKGEPDILTIILETIKNNVTNPEIPSKLDSIQKNCDTSLEILRRLEGKRGGLDRDRDGITADPTSAIVAELTGIEGATDDLEAKVEATRNRGQKRKKKTGA